MSDPYDTHDESNTPDDDGWDGNYSLDEVDEQSWQEFMSFIKEQEDEESPF